MGLDTSFQNSIYRGACLCRFDPPAGHPHPFSTRKHSLFPCFSPFAMETAAEREERMKEKIELEAKVDRNAHKLSRILTLSSERGSGGMLRRTKSGGICWRLMSLQASMW